MNAPILIVKCYLYKYLLDLTSFISPFSDMRDENDAQEYLEKFGNKVAIEKKINTLAGNGYFGTKKDIYQNSNIANVRALNNHKNDWTKEDILNREEEFVNSLIDFLLIKVLFCRKLFFTYKPLDFLHYW